MTHKPYLDGLHVKGGGEVVWSRVPPGGETVVSGEYVHPLPHPASLALPLLPHFCGPLFHSLKRHSEREQMDYKCIQIYKKQRAINVFILFTSRAP
jgi:hypothetical protein